MTWIEEAVHITSNESFNDYLSLMNNSYDLTVMQYQNRVKSVMPSA